MTRVCRPAAVAPRPLRRFLVLCLLLGAVLAPFTPAQGASRGIGPAILPPPVVMEVVAGVVRDHTGPLAGALLACRQGKQTWQAHTDRHGAYRLLLAPGRYSCVASATRHKASAPLSIQVPGRAMPALTFTLAGDATGPSPTPAPIQSACTWLSGALEPGLDSNAHYWGLYLHADPAVTLAIPGTYPQARYASLQAYTQQGALLAGLYDAQFPAQGHGVNPFVAGGPRGAGTWLVRIVFASRPARPVAGTLYLGVPTGEVVALAYRVYLPDANAGPAGNVGLPVVTARDATSGAPAGCPTLSSIPPQAQSSTPLSTTVAFSSTSFSREGHVEQAGYLNGDAAYLATYLPHTSNLYVVRFKAPTTPRTLDGEPFTPGTQLRYWSLCVYDWKLQPHPCLADEQVATDSAGNATVVLGPWWARPNNATTNNGVTWINMGAFALPYGLVLRQLLPAAAFMDSAAAVPVGARPASYMGAYAPTVVACTKAQFQTNLCAFGAATH